MKLITALLFLISTSAFADAGSQMVLQDPTVTAISKLMNDKYNGQCEALKDSDVVLHGTGFIPDVKKPTIVAVATLFSVTVKCITENATVRGIMTLWQLALPSPTDPKLQYLKPAQVSGGNTITAVIFSRAD